MKPYNFKTLGIFIFLGLTSLGFLLGRSIIKVKNLERTVVVKGLAEKEVSANIALWPIKFSEANNSLSNLYDKLEKDKKIIIKFLKQNGFSENEITISQPSITDKLALEYGNTKNIRFRYVANQAITVYSKKIEKVREISPKISELGKKGIVIISNNYESRIQYFFTKLNNVKPEMIKEATKKAREVALKFAEDSKSSLGKIKSARQGQFSIRDRDKNTRYIKKVRVVSTIEYYLSD